MIKSARYPDDILKIVYEIHNYKEFTLRMEQRIISNIVNTLTEKLMHEIGDELITNAKETILKQNFKDLSEEVTRRLVKLLLKD